MSLLLLHGSGWDEFLLLGVAILLGFLVVRFTMRPGDVRDAGEAGPNGAAEPTSTAVPSAGYEAGAAHDEKP